MHEEQRAETRNLISKIEKDNQMKRKHIISINSQINELSNTDTSQSFIINYCWLH